MNKLVTFIKTPTGIFVSILVVVAAIALWMNWNKWFGTCTTCGGTKTSTSTNGTATSSTGRLSNAIPKGTPMPSGIIKCESTNPVATYIQYGGVCGQNGYERIYL